MDEKIAFYRKYRPQGFDHLMGQDHIRTTLLNAIKNRSVSHGYLFCGPRGTGKTTTARLLAKTLNCLRPSDTGEPCEECEICNDIAAGRLIDVIEIDAASNRGIDEIRDLREKIKFAPTRAENKVYIIDEVHMLTAPAFNALLKTLEEPPSRTHFILATTEVHKIPETIISRCQRFDFKRIDRKTIMTRLLYIAQKEKIETEDTALELIAKNCEGGMRDAIGLLEQLSCDGKLTYRHVQENLGLAGHKTIADLFGAFMSCDVSRALDLIRESYREGYDLSELNREILEFMREQMLASVQAKDHALTGRIVAMIEVLEDARAKLRDSVIPELALEIAAIKICAEADMESAAENRQPDLSAVKDSSVKEIPVEDAGADASFEPVKTDFSQNSDAPDEKRPFTISHAKELWPRVIEHLKSSSLKRSLKEVVISKAEKDALYVRFSTAFHFEKANTTEHIAALESTLGDFFEKSVKVHFELAKLEPSDDPEHDDAAREAASIFGGEIID